LPTNERPESAWLYGDSAAAAQFDRLATLAWKAFHGTPDGKAQYAPTAENDTDRWLTVVERQLTFDLKTAQNYHQGQDCVDTHTEP
jgi:hypothetical protein